MKKRYDFGDTYTSTTVIDCLECENYYTGACDGNAGGCKAYTPTRKITMADDIHTIKDLCLANYIMLIGYGIASLILLISLIISAI